MSAWRLVVNWLLPPPLVLTVLLILPAPQVVKKGLLMFTRNFLFCRLAGQVKLVHMAIIITGVAFAASSLSTYRLSQTPLPDTLTSNQRTALLARRWREERNFWIACLTFLLWSLLYRMFALMLDHMALRDRVRYLEAVVAKIPAPTVAAATASAAPATAAAGGGGGGGKGGGGKGGGGKGVDVEPSAPPAPVEAKKTK